MLTRAALLRDKSAIQSRPRPAVGCRFRAVTGGGHPGKNQNSGVTDERHLFIDATAVVSMTPDLSGAPQTGAGPVWRFICLICPVQQPFPGQEVPVKSGGDRKVS